MADEAEVVFTGDTQGLEAAAQRTAQIIDGVRSKLQAQSNVLVGMAQLWAKALGAGASTNGLSNAERGIVSLGTKADQSRGQVDGLSKSMAKLGSGVALASLVKEVQDMADTWTRSGNLLAAVGVSYADLTARQHELAAMAMETRTALEPTVALYSRMYRAAIPLGFAQQDVARATEVVNKAMKAGGAAVSEQNAAIMQLSQSLGSGVLQGDELRSVRENAPLVAKAIADAFGTNIAGLKALGAAGKLTSDKVFAAIIAGGDAIDAQFARTRATVGDSFNNLRTAAIGYIGDADKATGSTKALSELIMGLAKNFKLVADTVITLGTVIGGFLVARAITPLIVAFGTWIAEMRVAAVMTFALTKAEGQYSAATVLATGATRVLGAAMAALGGPIGIIITLVLTVGPLIYNAFNQGKEEVEDFNTALHDSQDKLGKVQEYLDEIAEHNSAKLTGTMNAFSASTETAAQAVERLKAESDDIEFKHWTGQLENAREAIVAAQKAIKDNQDAWDAFSNKNQKNLEIYNTNVAALKKNADEAAAALTKVTAIDWHERDSGSDKKVEEAQLHSLDVQAFAARNNAKQQIAIEQERVDLITRLHGNESKEYIAAVKQKEAAEKAFATANEQAVRKAESEAKEAMRLRLEEFDTEQEGAKENYDEWTAINGKRIEYLRTLGKLGLKEIERANQAQIREDRKHADELYTITKGLADRDAAIATSNAQTQEAIAQRSIDRKKQIVGQAAAQGAIDEKSRIALIAAYDQQELANKIALEQTLFKIHQTTLEMELEQDNLTVIQKQAIRNKMLQDEIEYNNKIRELNSQKADVAVDAQQQQSQRIANEWSSALQPVKQAIGGLYEDMKAGTNSWENNVTKALRTVWNSFLGALEKMAEQWLINQLVMTQAQAAGATTRTAIQTTETGTGMALQGSTAFASILNYAWTAAAGAFSAMAGIPYIGPILAVAAGAAALAAVIGFGSNIVSAEGGWDRVPYDGAKAVLHKNEMVLPARYANPLREMLTGFGVPGGHSDIVDSADTSHEEYRKSNETTNIEGDTHLHYAPQTNIRNETLERQLRTQGKQFQRWAANQIRNNR